jgi:hypothetical protein
VTKKDGKHAQQSTIAMIRACFRHQHPAEFGRAEVDEGDIPSGLLYGPGEEIVPQRRRSRQRSRPEEEMGNPDAVPI